MAQQPTVPVYEFLFADGTSFGLGTEAEFKHWQAEGVFEVDARLGGVLSHEPASTDEKRKAAWSRKAAEAYAAARAT